MDDYRTALNAGRNIDVAGSRALAAKVRALIGRLQTRLEATRERLLKSQRRLEQSRARLLEAPVAEPLGTLSQRFQTLSTSVEELHFRLGVEASTIAEELQALLVVTDELRSLADFCALLEERPLSEVPAGHGHPTD